MKSPTNPAVSARILMGALCVAALLLPLRTLHAQDGAAATASRPTSAPAPKKTFFWFMMWPDQLVKFDPVTDTIVGKIQFKNGLSHEIDLAHDRKQFFAVTGQKSTIEIVSLADMAVKKEHSFKEPGFINRIDSVREVPGGEQLYVRLTKIKILLDHYEVKEPEWILYTLANREWSKPMKELPESIRRGARISPDGKKWHLFGNDISIVDPKTLKEEGKIDLSTPQYGGMGAMRVHADDLFDGTNPDAYRMLYTMADPVLKNRSLCGVVDISIKDRKIISYREWGFDPRLGNMELSHNKKIGFAQKGFRGGNGSRTVDGEPKVDVAVYDIDTGKKLREAECRVREGMGIAAVSPDGKKVYLAGRGHEFEIFDDQLKHVKTLELGGDIDGRMWAVDE